MSDEQLDVFGWLADRTGCGQYRLIKPLDALAKERGYKTQANERMLRSKDELPKTFVGQRVCKDGPSSLWFQIAVHKDRPRTVYEVDDDLWNIDASNVKAFNWFINGIDDEGVKHDVQGNIRRNVAVADYVTCTTEPLAELLRNFNPNVHIIPNYIPRWLTEWERPRSEEVTVGWAGSGTHSMDWAAEGSHIARYIKRSGTRFTLIGGNSVEHVRHIGMPVEHTTAVKWFPDLDEYWKNINFDIGVIPLRPHLFNQSKSAIKALEFAALGIPVVASDTGPYTGFVAHGVTGYKVKRDHEWGKYLRMLVEDEDMRVEMGNNARKQAKQWVLEDHLDEYERVYFG